MYDFINHSPLLPSLLAAFGLDKFEDFFLIDVGASGGISDHWKAFGEKLNAIGFDPLLTEVERLNKLNTNPKISYEAGFITYSELDTRYEKDCDLNSCTFWERTSAARAEKNKNYSHIETRFNNGEKPVYSTQFFNLDDFVKSRNIHTADFIKIDTDGHDFPVLLGADHILDNHGVLGVEIEAQFHGPSASYSNTFSNIDQLLRSKGFTLFSLNPYRFSRGDFPSDFLYDIYAQTKLGQVRWADAVYFRDLADINYSQKTNFSVTSDKVIKLAYLYELYNLRDCAVELLINRTDEFNFPKDSLRQIFDAMVPFLQNRQLNYKEYMKEFDTNPDQWFPVNSKTCKEPSKHNGLLEPKTWKLTKLLQRLLNQKQT